MPLVRTMSEAYNVPSPSASWKHRIIQRVTMGGVELYRVTEHDEYKDRCKRCKGNRRASVIRGVHSKIPSTGHQCDRCGNQYAGFIRCTRVNRNGQWQSIPGSFSSSGKLG